MWAKRILVAVSIVFVILAVTGTVAFVEAKKTYSTWTFEGSPK